MIQYLKSNFFTLSMLVLVLAFIAYQRLPVFLKTRPLVDAPAPEFFLPLLGETRGNAVGQTVRLSDYRGQKVLLNFWATWCGPCIREVPDLSQMQRELAEHNFVILAVSAEDPRTVQRFAKQHGIDYPVVLDPTGTAHDLYQVSLFPTMVWIDENGRIESFSHGADYILKQRIRFWVTGSIFAPEKSTDATRRTGGEQPS